MAVTNIYFSKAQQAIDREKKQANRLEARRKNQEAAVQQTAWKKYREDCRLALLQKKDIVEQEREEQPGSLKKLLNWLHGKGIFTKIKRS